MKKREYILKVHYRRSEQRRVITDYNCNIKFNLNGRLVCLESHTLGIPSIFSVNVKHTHTYIHIFRCICTFVTLKNISYKKL